MEVASVRSSLDTENLQQELAGPLRFNIPVYNACVPRALSAEGGQAMSRNITCVFMVMIVAEAIAWGLISGNALFKARLELSSLRMETASLGMNLETANSTMAETEEDLTLARQELSSVLQETSSYKLTISSLESKLELYEDTWGLTAAGIQPPFQGADIVNNGTATNPTWAQLSDFLLRDKTDQNDYVPGVYMCDDFARDVHNNAEQAGIRAAYVVVELPNAYHSLNAFRTTDRSLVFMDCTGREASQSSPSNCDKTVSVRLGKSYVPKSLFPECGWPTTWEDMGTILDAEIYW